MDKAEFEAQFEAIKDQLPEGLRSEVENVIAQLGDDLFTLDIPTWGDGFGAEGYAPGGSITVGKAMGRSDRPDERTLSIGVVVNTWGVDVQEAGTRLTFQLGRQEGGSVKPYAPIVHLDRAAWEQVKAAAEKVFG